MASLDASGRQRDSLPSIINLDFDKYRMDKNDHNRYSMPSIPALSRTSLSSPPTSFSGPPGPPPPYSSTIPGPVSIQGMPGYISPPESNSRRSTRDDKDSVPALTSLPSISEALKSADVAPVTQQYSTKPVPISSASQTFSDAPRGPGNPFSQSAALVSTVRPSFSTAPELSSTITVPPPPTLSEPRQATIGHALASPRLNPVNPRPSAHPLTSASQLETPYKSSFSVDPARPGYPFPEYPTVQQSTTPHMSKSFNFESHGKPDDARNPFVKPDSVPYNETVKRHLDIYDAEVALNEIHDASLQTLEFSKVWSQRYHQANRTSYVNDGLPGTSEVDEMIRYSHHIIDGLTKLRDVAVMQQNVINEQRARAARGQHMDDDYQRMSEDYKSGGFAGGDAKKRRGKAAPPGRCHSCNRAETPEWRRGPDGARTLCNACGLHYAKLTRKMGTNKAAVMTGSNLRPKGLTDTQP